MQEATNEVCGAPAPAAGTGSVTAALAHGLSASDLARKTATQLTVQSQAEAKAAADGTRMFVHGPGGSMHERKGGGGGSGGKEISLRGLGLTELPQEVFDVGVTPPPFSPACLPDGTSILSGNTQPACSQHTSA